MAYTHHEWWNGSGYPEELKGAQIPFAGRIMALADVYDSLITKRTYKKSMSHKEAVRIILEGKGTQFDPDLVEAFLRIEDQWRRIALEFTDHPEVKDPPASREI